MIYNIQIVNENENENVVSDIIHVNYNNLNHAH